MEPFDTEPVCLRCRRGEPRPKVKVGIDFNEEGPDE